MSGLYLNVIFGCCVWFSLNGLVMVLVIGILIFGIGIDWVFKVKVDVVLLCGIDIIKLVVFVWLKICCRVCDIYFL